MLPERADLEAAARRLADRTRRTPMLELSGHDLDIPGRVLLKLELTQHSGSFKARGAMNSVLTMPDGTTGVFAASGGNHGAALAWAAVRAGVTADVFVPATSPQEKVDRIRGYGATAHIIDGYYPDALAAATQWAEGHGAGSVTGVHAYDQFSTVCGASTVGLEVGEQAPEATLVLVACGGGGLYAGTALALQDSAAVLPVEPERCANLTAAQSAGEPVAIEVGGVAADSLGAAKIGSFAFETASLLGTTAMTVTDEQIVAARNWLWERCRILAEPGAVTPLAAVLSGAVPVHAGQTAVVVVSGGNNPEIP